MGARSEIPSIAQTNIQLYSQLRAQSWATADLHSLRSAYELMMQVFAGQYRSNGKPFVDHLVGTASVAAASTARTDIVLAALCHASYNVGEWGNGVRGATPQRREAVRSVVGSDAEELVLGYRDLAWTNSVAVETAARYSQLSAFERDVITMRLANEIEERHDLGLFYSAKRLDDVNPLLELAEGLQLTRMAEQLADIASREREVVPEPALAMRWKATVRLAPLSHRLRYSVIVPRLKKRARVRVGRTMRRLNLR